MDRHGRKVDADAVFFDAMSTDITDVVQRYRLALRYIWNSCIWVEPNSRNWDSVYAFRSLKLPLFRTLIADQLDIQTEELFGKGFQVVPENGRDLPMIQINSQVPSSPSAGIWVPLKGAFTAADLKLTLIDLFDWSPLGYLDLRYYVVQIEEFQNHSDAVGQHALVDVSDSRVLWMAPMPEK